MLWMGKKVDIRVWGLIVRVYFSFLKVIILLLIFYFVELDFLESTSYLYDGSWFPEGAKIIYLFVEHQR